MIRVYLAACMLIMPLIAVAGPYEDLLDAIKKKNERLAESIVSQGNLDLNQRNKHGETPLHVAIAHRSPQMVKVLLDMQAKHDISNNLGGTPLHLAVGMYADCGDPQVMFQIVNLLLKKGANIHATTTKDQSTALHIAARANNRFAFCQLLIAGANPLQPDGAGQTAIALLRSHQVSTPQVAPATQALARGSSIDRSLPPRLSGSMDLPFLHFLAAAGKAEGLHNLARRGSLDRASVNLDYLDANSMTALHRAIIANQADSVKALLNLGANAGLATKSGNFPIHLAAANDSVEILLALLDAGAALHARDAYGREAIHVAANAGHFGMVDALLHHGATLDVFDDDGNTPLHRAARARHLEMCAYLIARGANVFVENTNHENFRAVIDAHGGREVSEIISAVIPTTFQEALAAGSESAMTSALLNSRNPPAILERTNTNHDSIMLQLAARARPLTSDVSKQATNDRLLALRERFAHQRCETPMDLITLLSDLPEFGPWMLNLGNKQGMTAVHMAAMINRMDLVALFVDAGGELERPDNDGMTPLHLAANAGNVETVIGLARRGARVDAQDKNGMTPLHRAAQAGHAAAMVALIRSGADPFAKDNRDRMPWNLISNDSLRHEIDAYIDEIRRLRDPHLRQPLPADAQARVPVAVHSLALAGVLPDLTPSSSRASSSASLVASTAFDEAPFASTAAAAANPDAIDPEPDIVAVRGIMRALAATLGNISDRWTLCVLCPNSKRALEALFVLFLTEIRMMGSIHSRV